MKVKKYWTASAEIFWKKRDTILCETDGIPYGDILTSHTDAEKAARSLLDNLFSEAVVVIMLDSQNKIMGAAKLESGVSNQCSIYSKKIFAAAILAGASSIILVHNHPGGAITPSEADWNITAKLSTAGKALDLPLIDHLIITENCCISMRNNPRWN